MMSLVLYFLQVGMCDIGRIKHHLKHHLWKENSTILFVGYQAPGTLGRSIVDGAEKVKIFGEEIAVRARIEYIEGFSGHADQEWLLNFLYSFTNPPKHVFLVHGEEEAQLVLKDKIEETTECKVTIPYFGECYELTSQEEPVRLEEGPEINKFKKKVIKKDLIKSIEKFKNQISDVEELIREENLDTNDEELKSLSTRIGEIQNKIKKLLDE